MSVKLTAAKRIAPSLDVLKGYQQGAALAASKQTSAKKSSGGKKKGVAKKKIYYPPSTGWRGFAGAGKAVETQIYAGWLSTNKPLSKDSKWNMPRVSG